MASTGTGTDTTDLATTSSYGGNMRRINQTLAAVAGTVTQEGARKVKSLMSVLR